MEIFQRQLRRPLYWVEIQAVQMERFLQRTYPLLFHLKVALLHLEVPPLHYFPLLVNLCFSLMVYCSASLLVTVMGDVLNT